MIRQRLAQHAGELIALILLIPLAILFGRLLWLQPQGTPNVPATPTATSAAPSTTTVAASTTPATAYVTLQIVNPSTTRSYKLPLPGEQATVAALLLKADQAGIIAVKTTDYGGSLGLFIEEINGLKNAPQSQFYWQLYINNAHSPLGASTAVVRAGDIIKWSYEKEHTE